MGISDKAKDGKLYEYCKKCNKKLHYADKIGICQTCKVKKFDNDRKQNITLINGKW